MMTELILVIRTEKVANELQISVKEIIEYSDDDTPERFFGMFGGM